MERCGDCVRRVEAANAVLQSENALLKQQLTVKREARTETPPTGDLIPHRRGSRFLVVASTRGRGRKGRSRRHKGRSHRHKGRSHRHKGRSHRHKGRSRRHKGRSRRHKGRSRRHKGRSRRHKGRSRRR